MRYAQRGGYTPAEQQRRERPRMEAAGRFAHSCGPGEAELRKGPLAHGFANDQRWTLGRIKTLIGKLLHVGYTVERTSKLMRTTVCGPVGRPAPVLASAASLR